MSRTCVLEDMNSQCGLFKFQVRRGRKIEVHIGVDFVTFQNDTMNGCILTCEHDGCNSAITLALYSAYWIAFAGKL